jgi:hypothetical protein
VTSASRLGWSALVAAALFAPGLRPGPVLAQPARPTTLHLLPNAVRFENVQYAPGTPADLTEPAAGNARLVLTLGAFSAARDGVTFTNLLFDAQGQLRGVVFALDQKLTTESVAGCVLEIPAGTVTWRMPDSLSFAAPCIVRLPFRNPDGSPVTGQARRLSAQATPEGTVLTLDGLVLQGPAGANGLAFPGLRVAAAPCHLRMSWSGAGPAAWELEVPSARVHLGVPGLATEAEPIDALATRIRIEHTGEVSFESATLTVDRVIAPIQMKGLEIRIRSGTVGMVRSVPTFQGVRADLRLPEAIRNAAGTGPASIQDVGLNVDAGLVLDIGRPLSASVGLPGATGFRILLGSAQMVLDLSDRGATSVANAPAEVLAGRWTGIWFREGRLKIPLGTGAETLAVDLSRFHLDASGLSGSVRVSSGLPRLTLEGFEVALNEVQLGFLKNQIVEGRLGGTLEVGSLGDLAARIEFSLRGLEAIALGSESGLQLSQPLGFSIRKVKGSLDLDSRPAMLVLSGTLDLEQPDLETKISNFRIDGAGRLYLPEEGVLTLNDPAVVDVLGVLEVEVRRIGFSCPDGVAIESISFTGAARLKQAVDGMDLGGEVDLEHLTVRPGPVPRQPVVEIGGLGLTATIPELGTIGASLKMSDELEGFRGIPVLYGDAEFALQPLGNVGLDVTFLLALDVDRQAWFVGGDAMLPQPVRVDIPPTPPKPQIPLFQIKGFLGGFGMNVAPLAAGGGIGPIKEPEAELKFSRGTVLGQAGLMLAEYAVGDRVWWADATLTATFRPTMFDLTGRMALLDLGGVTGFPSNAAWKERDRIARVFVNLDLDSQPSFTMGGDMDMNFPTRRFALADASGEALLRFAAAGNGTEAFVRAGCWWCSPKQRALQVGVARALDDVVELRGKVGMELDFVQKRGEMRFDTRARFKPVDVRGTLKGKLKVESVGSSSMEAEGDLALRGVADFEVVECTVRGDVRAKCSFSRVSLDGTLRGRVGCFEGEVDVSETFR